MATPALHVFRDPEQASALLQPVRLRLLERLKEPSSASILAKEVGLPRQQVNYHLRELERLGAVELVEERRKGNCTERMVRAVASSYLISPEALGALGTDAPARRDRFSVAYLTATAARAIRELAILTVRARRARKRLATLTVEAEIRFRTAGERNRFAEEAANFLAAAAAKYHDENTEGGRPFRVVLASYPLITRSEDDGGEAASME
jgi:DNA-binding transcriptional ArsR family regulator